MVENLPKFTVNLLKFTVNLPKFTVNLPKFAVNLPKILENYRLEPKIFFGKFPCQVGCGLASALLVTEISREFICSVPLLFHPNSCCWTPATRDEVEGGVCRLTWRYEGEDCTPSLLAADGPIIVADCQIWVTDWGIVNSRLTYVGSRLRKTNIVLNARNWHFHLGNFHLRTYR